MLCKIVGASLMAANCPSNQKLQGTFGTSWFTLFVTAADVHEQLPDQLTGYLVKGSSFGGDGSIFGTVVPPYLKADAIL